jgi:type II secretory pathway component GspD/PulD (secretin)
MEPKFTIVLLSAFVCLSVTTRSFAQDKEYDFYQPWVDYRNGEISVAFERTPVQFALHAFKAKTGMEIVIPSNTDAKVVNLRLERQLLEPAVRSLISQIGYKNFALMYDETGRPNRAVVLGAQVEMAESAPTQRTEPTAPQLTAEERDRLMNDLQRWRELKEEERGRIEDRLKSLPASDDRDRLVREYGRQVLGLTKDIIAAKN